MRSRGAATELGRLVGGSWRRFGRLRFRRGRRGALRLGFRRGRGQRDRRGWFWLSFRAGYFRGGRVGSRRLDRLLVILLGTLERIGEMVLGVFGDDDPRAFILRLASGRFRRLPSSEERRFQRPEEKQNMYENAEYGGQLDGATNRPIVDEP